MEKEQGVGRLRFLDPLARLFRSRARAQTAEKRAVDRGRRLVTRGVQSAMLLVCVALLLGLASPAAAAVQLKCSSWRRLSEDQKFATIDGAIDHLVSGWQGREYTSINRTQTGRCLERLRSQMVDDFDELCSRGMSTGLGALNETFRSYVWSCAQ